MEHLGLTYILYIHIESQTSLFPRHVVASRLHDFLGLVQGTRRIHFSSWDHCASANCASANCASANLRVWYRNYFPSFAAWQHLKNPLIEGYHAGVWAHVSIYVKQYIMFLPSGVSLLYEPEPHTTNTTNTRVQPTSATCTWTFQRVPKLFLKYTVTIP